MYRRFAVSAALAVLALGGACAQKSPVTSKTVSVVSQDAKATVFEQIDQGKKGFGTGDQIVEVAPLAEGGNSYTTVTVLSGSDITGSVDMIDCSVQLEGGGTVLFHGAFVFKDTSSGVTLPVVGGTGTYAGVGGTVKMVVPNDKQTNMTFDLLLPRTTS